MSVENYLPGQVIEAQQARRRATADYRARWLAIAADASARAQR